MPKFIREGRMGPPMSYKTGAVVGTYPRPLLHLGGDPHGLDIIPATKQAVASPFRMEVTQADVRRVTIEELIVLRDLPRGSLPPITHLNFHPDASRLGELYQPAPDSKNFPLFNRAGNLVIEKCPWKTVVVDPVTALTEVILGHYAVSNASGLADPRKWAASVGQKVAQTMSAFNRIQAHVVFIMHSSEAEKNETTSEVRIEPMIYSQFRQVVAGLFAQFFYCAIEGGKPVVWTQPQGYCKGIGTRWPLGLPAKCGAHFMDIYASAVASKEIEV